MSEAGFSGAGFEQALCIDARHPALPGHFPDQPLVPAVILLEQLALALRAWRGQALAGVPEAKFVAALLPDQVATLRLTEADAERSRYRFEIRRDGILLARGMIEGAT